MNNTAIDTSHYDQCHTLSLRLKNSHTVRSLLLCFFALMNGYLHTSTLSIVKGTGESGYSPIAIFTFGFVYAVVALFALIAVVLLGILLRQEKGKLLIIPTAIAAVCTLTGLFHVFWGLAMTVVLAIGLWESRSAVWLTQQEGYPYFNTRFAEQQAQFGKEYQPTYSINKQAGQKIPEIGDECDNFNIGGHHEL